jgi:hypothetical protein
MREGGWPVPVAQWCPAVVARRVGAAPHALAFTGAVLAVASVAQASTAPDVSGVTDLSLAPASDVVAKRLVSRVTDCPTLGATSPEPQTNPLMDNYEGMAVTPSPGGAAAVSMISDDNFSAGQVTRVLNLAVRLP